MQVMYRASVRSCASVMSCASVISDSGGMTHADTQPVLVALVLPDSGKQVGWGT